MSDAYQFRTLDRTQDIPVIDRDDIARNDLARDEIAPDDRETRLIESFTPATPRWIPPKSEATEREVRVATVRRQAFEFGRIRWGAAFFGWVVAAGLTVLLAAAFGAIGAGVGLALNGRSMSAAEAAARSNATVVGVVGAAVVGVTLIVAFSCGGYVAGRMARFAGTKQGFAVWLWAVAVAIVGVAGAYFAGALSDPIGFARGLPGLPNDQGTLVVAGAAAVAGIAVVTIVGTLLGGRLGMRFHRRVDFAALDD